MTHSTATPPMDFLSRLVGRARGVDSAIEPRLPSLFEPVSHTDVPPAAEAEFPTHTVASIPRSKAREIAPSVDKDHVDGALLSTAPPAATEAGREEAGPAKDKGEGTRREGVTPPAAATLLPKDALPRRSGPGATADTAPVPRREQAKYETDAVETGGPVMVHAQPALMASSRTPVMQMETDLRKPKDAARDRPIPERPEKPACSGALVPDAMAARMPRAGFVAEGKPLFGARHDTVPGESAMNTQEPVINVSIGRVEVRAVQPAPGRPHVEPPRPKPMSLDDYLTQRRGKR